MNTISPEDIQVAGRIWNAMEVRDRVVMIRDTGKISGHVGSAAWSAIDPRHQNLIAEILVGDDEKHDDTDADDRSIHMGWSEGKPIYRASMAGHCVKELFLWRTGLGSELKSRTVSIPELEETHKGLLGAREGSLHEAWITEALSKEGYELTWTGDAQRELEKRFSRYVVRAHPDGMIRGKEIGQEWRVLECKALKQERFELWKRYGWDAFPNYAAQVSIEMYLAEAKAFYIVKNRNTGDVVKLKVDKFPIAPATLMKKFSSIEDLIQAKNDEGPACGDKAEWYFCPFFSLGKCDVLAKATPEEFEVVESKSFEDLLDAYELAKKGEKEVAEIKAGIRLKIMERMVKPKLRVGNFFAALSKRSRRGFDIPSAKNWIEAHDGDPTEFEYETEYEELRTRGERTPAVEEVSE